MAGDGKVRLPSSGGGLMQYYDEYSSKFSITPTAVIVMTIAFAVIIMVLHAFFTGTA